MSLKLLIDMNLSPDWAPVLEHHGWLAVHWSEVGDPRATDRAIMDWASGSRYIVFTHDLDFGTMLALTHATSPNVFQVRADDLLPDRIHGLVIAALKQHEADLTSGAIVVLEASRSRVRVLPF